MKCIEELKKELMSSSDAPKSLVLKAVELLEILKQDPKEFKEEADLITLIFGFKDDIDVEVEIGFDNILKVILDDKGNRYKTWLFSYFSVDKLKEILDNVKYQVL